MSKPRHAHTCGDCLALEADAPAVRHEYVDGDILAVAGGSDLHFALIAAVSGELYRELRGTPAACASRTSESTCVQTPTIVLDVAEADRSTPAKFEQNAHCNPVCLRIINVR